MAARKKTTSQELSQLLGLTVEQNVGPQAVVHHSGNGCIDDFGHLLRAETVGIAAGKSQDQVAFIIREYEVALVLRQRRRRPGGNGK